MNTAPGMPSGKAGPATPKMVETPELEEARGEAVKLPLHEDIMQLARLGEVGPIQTLFDQGKYDARYKDEEDITPLHWAAINNQYAVCKFLIEAGADVNAVGGESRATPAAWAAQRCHPYTVHLLLQHGADPLLQDDQGYNMLHMSAKDGNVFQLLIILHENVPVDTPDPQGHTSLMWAVYDGYPAVADLLLRWGASVSARDQDGFTPLHWALVKGNQSCIQKLIESGADRFAETNDGKSPAVVAQEMKSKSQWHRALRELGFNSDATIKQLPTPLLSFIKTRIFMDRFFFIVPFVLLYIVLSILAGMPIYAAVPLAIFLAYSLQWVAQQVLQWAPSDLKHLHRTPYLAGVFAASLFWVGFRWISKILPSTYSSHPVLNIAFALLMGLCAYFYIFSTAEDPGYVPKLGSRSSQKAAIEELISLWKFDEENFCVFCMVRRPVRSKHCKRCARCVAKHDHHCPWIHNCVAANNLRHFFLYIAFLEAGILVFIRLAIYHVISLPQPAEIHCNILPDQACTYILRDPFTVVLSIWASLQLIWVTMLLVVQLVQISRAQTTWESMRGNMYHASKAHEAITSALTAGTTSMEGAQISGVGMGPNPAGPGGRQGRRQHPEGCFSQWKKLLGLDTFVATAAGGTGTHRRRNPFSRGVITNCRDFFCDPAPVFGKRDSGAAMLDGDVVNYTKMYETPSRLRFRRDGDGGDYRSVADDDDTV